jgi:hypothetical protein
MYAMAVCYAIRTNGIELIVRIEIHFMFAVPPSIIDKETSTDMVVREASNATLICKAAGYPEPYVMWRREDGEDINYNGDTGRP